MLGGRGCGMSYKSTDSDAFLAENSTEREEASNTQGNSMNLPDVDELTLEAAVLPPTVAQNSGQPSTGQGSTGQASSSQGLSLPPHTGNRGAASPSTQNRSRSPSPTHHPPLSIKKLQDHSRFFAHDPRHTTPYSTLQKLLTTSTPLERLSHQVEAIHSYLSTATKLRQVPWWNYLSKSSCLKLSRHASYRQVIDVIGVQFSVATNTTGSVYVLLEGSATINCEGNRGAGGPIKVGKGEVFGNFMLPTNLKEASEKHFAGIRPPLTLSPCEQLLKKLRNMPESKSSNKNNTPSNRVISPPLQITITAGSSYLILTPSVLSAFLLKKSADLTRTQLLTSVGLRCMEKLYKTVSFPPNTTIIKEGTPGAFVYLIVEGTCQLTKSTGNVAASKFTLPSGYVATMLKKPALAVLGLGSLVGDIPLLTMPKHANVMERPNLNESSCVSTTNVTALQFDGGQYVDRLDQYPDLKRAMVQMVRVRDTWVKERGGGGGVDESKLQAVMAEQRKVIRRMWVKCYIENREEEEKIRRTQQRDDDDDSQEWAMDSGSDSDHSNDNSFSMEESVEGTLDDEFATNFSVDNDSLGLNRFRSHESSSSPVQLTVAQTRPRTGAPSDTASQTFRRKKAMVDPETYEYLDLGPEDFDANYKNTEKARPSTTLTVDIGKNRAIIKPREVEKAEEITFELVFQQREKKNPKITSMKFLEDFKRRLRGEKEKKVKTEYVEPKDRFERFEFIDLEKWGALEDAGQLQFSPTRKAAVDYKDIDLLTPYPTITKERKLHGKSMPLVSHSDGYKDPFQSIKPLDSEAGEESRVRAADQAEIDKALTNGFFPYHAMRSERSQHGVRPVTTSLKGSGSLLQNSVSEGSLKMGSSIWTAQEQQLQARFGDEEPEEYVNVVAGRAQSAVRGHRDMMSRGGGRGLEGGGGGTRGMVGLNVLDSSPATSPKKGTFLPSIGIGGSGLGIMAIRSTVRAKASTRKGARLVGNKKWGERELVRRIKKERKRDGLGAGGGGGGLERLSGASVLNLQL